MAMFSYSATSVLALFEHHRIELQVQCHSQCELDAQNFDNHILDLTSSQ